VSAGASGYNDYSLFVWDLRTSSPIEEREKSSDILCAEVCEDDKNVFVGNSAQLVKHIELNSGPSEAMSPPHGDAVTCLTKYRGILVSGSKDKSMKYWDMRTRQLMHSHPDSHHNVITCMTSDEDFIYTGCKDNIVKAWQFKEISKDQIDEDQEDKENTSEKITLKIEDREEEFDKYKADVESYMLGHSAQINSICAMNDE